MSMSDSEVQLWQRYAATRDARVRSRLIEHYMPLVWYVVKKLAVTLPKTVDQNDLSGYGSIGLIEAVEKFKVERGVKFQTYAITRIRGAILDEMRKQDWVPRSVRSHARNVFAATQALEAILGRTPTDEELADRLGISTRDLEYILSQDTSSFLSLDELIQVSDDGQTVTWLNTVPDHRPNPAVRLDEKEVREQLTKIIDTLPEREKILIALYYQEDMTFKEIGMVFRVSETRVCQLHAQALERIRTRMSQYVGYTISSKCR